MRIRKNAKVSPVLLMYTSSLSSSPAAAVIPEGLLQTHVCQLNQSPWDAIPFAQYSHQNEGKDNYNSSFTANGSLGDSIGAVESSEASMMDIGEDNKIMVANEGENNAIIVVDDDHQQHHRKSNKNDSRKRAGKVSNDSGLGRVTNNNNNTNNNLVMGLCQKNDGKGWQCKREAKEGYNFCEHHLSLFRSYNNNSSDNATTPDAKPGAPSLRRTRGASGAKAAAKRPLSSNSNPYEFYYYSGFGPLWARKRGERGDHGGGGGGGGGGGDEPEIKAATENGNYLSGPSSMTTPTTSQIDVDRRLDYVEEDEDEDEDEEDNGKKRMRKPVKARSLKSLM